MRKLLSLAVSFTLLSLAGCTSETKAVSTTVQPESKKPVMVAKQENSAVAKQEVETKEDIKKIPSSALSEDEIIKLVEENTGLSPFFLRGYFDKYRRIPFFEASYPEPTYFDSVVNGKKQRIYYLKNGVDLSLYNLDNKNFAVLEYLYDTHKGKGLVLSKPSEEYKKLINKKLLDFVSSPEAKKYLIKISGDRKPKHPIYVITDLANKGSILLIKNLLDRNLQFYVIVFRSRFFEKYVGNNDSLSKVREALLGAYFTHYSTWMPLRNYSNLFFAPDKLSAFERKQMAKYKVSKEVKKKIEKYLRDTEKYIVFDAHNHASPVLIYNGKVYTGEIAAPEVFDMLFPMTLSKDDYSKAPIVFGSGKKKVAVFADPLCPFSEKALSEIFSKYGDKATYYVFLLPVHGRASMNAIIDILNTPKADRFDKMRLYLKGLQQPPENVQFNPNTAREYKEQEEIVNKMRISGTPTFFFPDGTKILGADMKKFIDELEK